MTLTEAYKIVGARPGEDLQTIKKKYRQLIMRLHPDALASSGMLYPYDAQEINTAYALLKKEVLSDTDKLRTDSRKSAFAHQEDPWDGPVNEHGYREREIFCYAEDYEGRIIGKFSIARGKYLWKTEEDFPLFLHSIYQCGKEILDEIDNLRAEKTSASVRERIHGKLTYLLAQQYMDGTALLKELTKEMTVDKKDGRIFYLSAMLESQDRLIMLKEKDVLYPSRLNQHRLYLKNESGKELGYLSFFDDRLYYIIIPLFEQRRVLVKIRAASPDCGKGKKKTSGYYRLHLWLKMPGDNPITSPENLNLQIEQLLTAYR